MNSNLLTNRLHSNFVLSNLHTVFLRYIFTITVALVIMTQSVPFMHMMEDQKQKFIFWSVPMIKFEDL